MKITKLKDWAKLEQDKLLVTGPCSAESEEQVMKIADGLSKLNRALIFRAGIWKPRTRPNSFEGVGAEGLKWFSEVKKKYGFLSSTEVANTSHVEDALKNNIDVLWIGARTTASPFAVQEISNALKGVDIPVMVKNPVNAELALWIGSLERLNQVGITKLVAIHRGFSGLENGIYRNLPMWALPLQLKRSFPDLPIICDPSHIAGKRDLVGKVCQMAMNYDLDGLMIECHHDPDKALSDSQQQLTPKQLDDLLKSLTVSSSTCSDDHFENSLAELRSKIDRLDSDILEVLKLRFDLCEEIGELKSQNNVTPVQVNRFDELMKNRHENGKRLKLSENFIEKLFNAIHEESVRLQSELGKGGKDE